MADGYTVITATPLIDMLKFSGYPCWLMFDFYLPNIQASRFVYGVSKEAQIADRLSSSQQSF